MNLDVPGLDRLGDLTDKRVVVRADFNVPVNEAGEITDDTRIRAALPTLREILARGGRPVVLVHFGRPKGQVVESLRVGPIGVRLAELLGSEVITLKESVGAAVEGGGRRRARWGRGALRERPVPSGRDQGGP